MEFVNLTISLQILTSRVKDPVIAADGFSYEPASIKHWFQIRRSSPSTGLELRSTRVRRNANLAKHIKKWISGETIAEPGPRPSKRTRQASTVELNIKIQFFTQATSFSREVPKLLSIVDLYKFAFQGMKGQHAAFELRHSDQVLRPSLTSITEQGVIDGSAINIQVLTPRQVSQISTGNPANLEDSVRVEPQELFLLKAYQSRDKPVFSYWVPRKNSLSFASVIFRNWRYDTEAGQGLIGCDVDIWTEMRHAGDSQIVGVPNPHWNKIWPFPASEHGAGILGHEKLYQMKGDPESEINSSALSGNIQVLKASIEGHESQSAVRKAHNKREDIF